MRKTVAAVVGGGHSGYIAAATLKHFGVESIFFQERKISGISLKFFDRKQENSNKLMGGIEPFLLKQKIDIITERVVEVTKSENTFRLKTPKDLYTAEYIVLVSGFIPEELQKIEDGNIIVIKSEQTFSLEQLYESFACIIKATSHKDQW